MSRKNLLLQPVDAIIKNMQDQASREEFKQLCDNVALQDGLIISVDAPGIMEFFTKEGVPTLRLMYMKSVKDKIYKIFVSLHIGLDPIEAIHNYTTVLKNNRNVTMVQCYFKDASGKLFVGPEAEFQSIQAKAASFGINLPAVKSQSPVYFRKKAYSSLEEAMHFFEEEEEDKGSVH